MKILITSLTVLSLFAIIVSPVYASPVGNASLVSRALDGYTSDRASSQGAFSGDGRYVVFLSESTDIISNDTNNESDLFVLDQVTNTIEIVSVSSEEELGNASVLGSSRAGTISADGRFVAFSSSASNLVINDTNGEFMPDVFVRDRTLGTTELISISTDGIQGNSASTTPYISRDGRYVTFISDSTNLIAGQTTTGLNLFLHDRTMGTTELISIALNSTGSGGAGGEHGSTTSDDGRYIAFSSTAENLVTNDTNGKSDIFLRDRLNQTTTIVSKGILNSESNGDSSHVGISGDGRYIVYGTYADNIVANDNDGYSEIIIYDRINDSSKSINPTFPNGFEQIDTQVPTISGDGKYITYKNNLRDTLHPLLFQYGWNSILYDRLNDTAEIMNVYDNGTFIGESIQNTSVSDNGRYVMFDNADRNIVPYDNNFDSRNRPLDDVFIVDRTPPTNLTPHVTIDGVEESNNGTETYTFTVYEKNSNDSFSVASGFPSCGNNGSIVSGSLTITSTGGSFQCVFSEGANSEVSIQVEDDQNVKSNVARKIVELVPEGPIEVSFNASGDAFIRTTNQQRNFGAENVVKIMNDGDHRSLIKFDQSALQNAVGSHQILSAKVRLTVTDNGINWDDGRWIDLHALEKEWVEGNGTEADRGTGQGATWDCAIDNNIANTNTNCSGVAAWNMTNNGPFLASITDSLLITNTTSGVLEFDVTTDVQSFLNGTLTNNGWVLKKKNENQGGRIFFGSKESSTPPQLVVTYQ